MQNTTQPVKTTGLALFALFIFINTPSAYAAGDPSGYMFDAQGTQHVVYRASNGHVYELWWDSGGWHPGDLTAVTGAPGAAALGDPAGYMFDAQGTQHVVYRGGDGHVYELWWDSGGWHPGDLTAVTGAPGAAGDPSGYMFDAQGTQHVVYRGGDGHIYELWWDSGGWHPGDLTAVTRAPGAAGDPSGYMFDAQGTQHVVYRGGDGHIYELWWDSGGWHPGDLTAVTRAPGAAGDPSGYMFDAQGTQHVVYRGGDGHIYELWWDSGGWHPGDLTAVTRAPGAAGDPSGYMFDAQGTQHVVYRGGDGHVYELWWDSGGWHPGDLTAVTGAPGAAGDPSGYMFDAQGTQHVVYRGGDGHVYELWWDSGGWHPGDLTAVTGAPGATEPPAHVRRNINSLAANGPEIAALRKGFQVMQGRQPSDPTSSIYQANMHDTVDTPFLTNWGTCQHGTFFFLSWHRMYLYYFERILRAASGDPNLTLPYWNYSDPNDRNARALPLPFRQPADASNPLYVSQRDATMNAGGFLQQSAVSLAALTNFTNFSSPPGSGLSFGGQTATAPSHSSGPHSAFENTPHDVVHVSVGGGGSPGPSCCWMSSFEWAARDPIFWLHHANIDRLWEQWLAQGGGRSNPTDQVWLTTQFEFFDENGHSVKLSGQQIVDTAGQLNYVYNENPWDKIAQVTPKSTTPASPTGAAVPSSDRSVRQVGTSKVPAVELRREPVTVPVKLVKEEEFNAKVTGRAVVLDVEGVEFDHMPSGYYEIYLNLPQGERPDFRSKYYVGNLPFFGLKPRGQRHEGEEPPRFSYDITKVIDRLKSDKKWNSQEARITFVKKDVIPPPGMRVEAKVVPVRIGHVTITTE